MERCAKRRKLLLVELKTVNKDLRMNGVSDEDSLPRRRRAYVSERVGGRASKRASDRRPLASSAVARAVASETAKGGRPCREKKLSLSILSLIHI